MNTSDPGGTPPLADHDRLTVGELEHRIRSLSASETEQLTRHEDEHAARRRFSAADGGHPQVSLDGR